MILVDMKCFLSKNKSDIYIDETLSVNELLEEIAGYFKLDKMSAKLVSVERKAILNRNESLKEQGVRGGDTLILIESVDWTLGTRCEDSIRKSVQLAETLKTGN